MSRILLVVAVLAVAGASAPSTELRKCVAANGAVSYQDRPCAPGAEQAWIQPVKTMAPAPVATAPAPPPARTARPRAGGRATASRAPAKREDPRRARCEQARREAKLTRDRLWNKLSFRQLSELDAEVARACARDG